MSEFNLPPASPAPLPPPAAAIPVRQTSTLAIVSLVAGIVGWLFPVFLGSLIAIITGHMARAEIRRNPGTMEGDGLAVAGLVLGWVFLIACVLAVIAIMLFFGGLALFLAAAH